MSEIRFTNLERVLNDYGERVVGRYRAKLAEPKVRGKVVTTTNATGTLSRLTHPRLENRGGRFILSVDFGVEYWHWLEYGTRLQGPSRRQGKFPPVSAIRKWVDEKPVIPYKGKDGRVPTKGQVAFLIARHIYRFGTPPLRFLEQSLEDGKKIYAMCVDAVRQDYKNYVDEILQGLK